MKLLAYALCLGVGAGVRCGAYAATAPKPATG